MTHYTTQPELSNLYIISYYGLTADFKLISFVFYIIYRSTGSLILSTYTYYIYIQTTINAQSKKPSNDIMQ